MNAGHLSMSMGLNTNAFSQGLASASASLSSWASRMQQQSNRALGNLQSSMTATGRQSGRMGGQMSAGFGLPMGSLGALIGRMGGLYSAFELAKQGLTIISDLNRLDRSLKAVSTSTADYERAQSFLQSTSKTLGLEYQSLTKAYVGLKASAQGTSVEGTQTEKIFLSVAKASSALGLSSEQAEGSLLAIQQMMSKGTIQAEELRGQLSERLPGSFRLLAQGMNVSEAKLNKMLEQGQVLSSVALPKLAAQLEKTYGASAQNGIKGMAGGFASLKTEVQLLLKAFDDTAGIDSFVGKVLSAVKEMTASFSALVRSGQFNLKTYYDLLQGKTSVSDIIKRSVDKDQERKNKAATVAEMSQLAPKDRQKSIGNTQSDLATVRGMIDRSTKQPLSEDDKINASRIKKENELAAQEKRLSKRLELQITEDKRLLEEEARSAKRSKAQADEVAANKKKAKDKEIYQAKEGYEGLVALRAQFEDRIKTIQSSGLTDPKTMKELDTLLKGFQAVDGSIKEIESSWENLTEAGRRGIDLEVRVKKTGETTTQKDFRGQAGTENFAPMPKVPTPGEMWERTNQQQTQGQQYEQNQKAQKEQAYARLDQAFTPGATETAKARFDEVYQAVVDGGGTLEQALNEANRKVVQPGEQLKESLSNALSGAATGAAEGFGELLGAMIAGTADLNQLPGMLGRLFGGIAKQMGKAMIAFGTAGISIKAFTKNPVGAIIGGIALTALGSALEASASKSMGTGMKKFAKGGVFKEPTVGLFGEYAGAGYGNAEIATPERLMKAIFRSELDKTGQDQPDSMGQALGRSARIVEMMSRRQSAPIGPRIGSAALDKLSGNIPNIERMSASAPNNRDFLNNAPMSSQVTSTNRQSVKVDIGVEDVRIDTRELRFSFKEMDQSDADIYGK